MIFWKHILEKLQDNQKIYILTVIENFGSSPGRKGFKMLVAQDEFIYGSIGGGVMEFTLVEEARKLLEDSTPPIFVKKQIHRGKIVDGSGMICSGEQTVAFHYFDHTNITVIQEILNCLHNGSKGTVRLDPQTFTFSTKTIDNRFRYEINSNENWFFEEHIGYRETVYIVGGGHVGVALSQLLKNLGFYVTVIDNRKNLNTLENNTAAHRKLVIDYNAINDYIPQDNHRYVAIMTNRYIDDKLVLSKIARNGFKYIGVLGSKAKLKTMWKELRKEGFTEADLDTIHAPIGLSIKSETPEEIAVSIAAQIIQLRNRNR